MRCSYGEQAREILMRIRDWVEDEEKALAWYRSQPIPSLGGRTAEDLVEAGAAKAVLAHLDRISCGGYA